MPIIRYGISQSGFISAGTYVSPWFVTTTTGICGLWIYPFRDAKPESWDKVGYCHLTFRTNPQQLNFREDFRVVLFEKYQAFLVRPDLLGNEYRLELDLAPWVRSLSFDFGTLRFS